MTAGSKGLVASSLALTVALSLAAGTARAGQGGPDAAGYTWYDVNAGCPVVSDAFQLASSRNYLVGQNYIGPIDLGFPFPFYDRVTTQVWVNRSGLILFSPPADQRYENNQTIPRGGNGPDGFLAAYWDSLELVVNPTVYYEQFPAEGFFKITVEMRPTDKGVLQRIAFEAYLYENGDMRVEYVKDPQVPHGATIGIEDFAGAIGLQVFKDDVGQGGFTFANPMPHSVCFVRRPTLECSGAGTIGCGATSGTTPATIVRNAVNYGCGTGSWLGKERVYRLQVSELMDLDLTLTGTGTRQMGVFLLEECDEFSCIEGGAASVSALSLAPGTYTVVVDARNTQDEGAFTLNVTCTPLSVPIACEEVLTDSNAGGPSRLDGYSCAPPGTDLAGPETYYSLDVAPPSNINVTVDSTHWAFIYPPGAVLDPTTCLSGGQGGAVYYDPPAGTYLVVIDSAPSAMGPYTVAVNCRPEIACVPGAGTLSCNTRIAGTTVGEPSFVDFYRCTGVRHGGPEAVFRFDNPVTQVVSFVLDDSLDTSMDVFLMDACNEGACLDLGDQEVSAELLPGTYYVAVDGSGTGADFQLDTICGNSLDPSSIRVTLAAGQCFTEHKTAWLTPEISKADVLFSIDLTGSMGGARTQLQTNMQQIIDELQAFIRDVNFGLISYKDYNFNRSYSLPCSYSGGIFGGYGGAGDYPYQLEQPITGDRAALQAAVNNLPPASGGGDSPESYSRALYEAYADPGVGWRTDAKRLVVDFGDEMPHDCNVLACLGGTDAGNRGIDLGRDGTENTADDLPILSVIQGLVDNQTTLLKFVNSGGSAGGRSYTEIWDCWAQQTSGEANQINADGTVPPALHPRGLPGLIGEKIAERGFFCSELELVASPGFEGWLVTATPTYTDVSLPTVREFDVVICAPAGTPEAPYDFEVQVLCAGEVLAYQTVHVDVVEQCAPQVLATPQDVTICLGDTTRLDASGMDVVNCQGGVVRDWTDGTSTWSGPSIDVTPTATTTYTVDAYCATEPTCGAQAQATVEVHAPPVFGGAAVRDPAYCNLGLELTWPAATFLDPTGAGTYSVYRSEIDCADALSRPPIASCLTGVRWVDMTTRDGRTYFYVVEAEDARTTTACEDRGFCNGGVATIACIATGVTETADPTLPAGVFATLRMSHRRVGGDTVGHEVTAHWEGARALLPDEHFHLLKAKDSPTSPFSLVNPEADLSRTYTEDDRTSRLQFFDLRVANGCEIESEDEYPPGY